ncbi:MAG: GspH/FimT family pseudopilin [Thiohalomonadales bacterium]|nr:GspH/FimT family pseudopilin [Thiohalomonadales bacterium]
MWGVDMDVTSFTCRDRYNTCRGKFLLADFYHAAGFTLVELLSTIAIVLILFGLGLPLLKTTVTTNRIATSVNAMAGTLAYTRSEAIRRNQHVVVCKSKTGKNCSREGDWRRGWLVYVDANQNRTLDEVETVLGAHHLGEKIEVDYRAFGSRHYLVYRPTGTTRTNGTFTFCDPAYPESAQALIITKTGRARLSDVAADGSRLDCGEI